MLSKLHGRIETDQTSMGASTPGLQSMYGSEYRDGKAEDQDQEQQEQEEDALLDELNDIYSDPAKLLQYRHDIVICATLITKVARHHALWLTCPWNPINFLHCTSFLSTACQILCLFLHSRNHFC